MIAQLQQLMGNKRKAREDGAGEEEQEGDAGSPVRKPRRASDEEKPPAGSPKRMWGLNGLGKRPAGSPAVVAAAKAAAGRAKAAAGRAKKVAAGRTKPAEERKLPPGWTREYRTRKSGASAGTVDTYYYTPEGQMLDSWKKVLKKLAQLSRG